MKKIDLLLKYLPDGKIVPVQFTYQNNTFLITAIGREWKDELGTHILVFTRENSVNELIHSSEDANWYLKMTTGPLKI